MVRAGYIGPRQAAEYMALAGRNDAAIMAICDPTGTAEPPADGAVARTYEAPEELVLAADLDALVLRTPPRETARLARMAATRGMALFLAPPIAADPDDAVALLDAVQRAGVVTCAGAPMRYAINLIQLRQMVRERTLGWLAARAVAGPGDGLPWERAAAACDLVRYVGGPVASLSAATRADGLAAAVVELQSGPPALISVANGWTAGAETSIEALADGCRMAWFAGTNHLVLDGREWRVAERNGMNDLHVAEMAAFTTAVRTGHRSPILCDCADAVETLRLVAMLRQAWEPAEGEDAP